MTDQPTPQAFDAYAHLKPYERAARILCGYDAQDPDAVVPVAHPLFPGVTEERPTWHFAAEGLIQFSKMLTALQQARAEAQAQAAAEGAHKR